MKTKRKTFRLFALALMLFGQMETAKPSPADELIRSSRRQLVQSRFGAEAWAHLTYAFLQKARETSDPIWYDSAQTAITNAVKKAPGNPLINQYLASVDMAFHRFAEAVLHSQKALQPEVAEAELLGMIGDAYLEMGMPESTRVYYQRMDASAPRNLAAEARRAFWWDFLGQTDSARACLARAYALAQADRKPAQENLAWLCVMQGEIELGEGNFSRADSFYQTALAHLPDYPLALEHTAEIQLMGKRFEKAIKLYRQAVALSGNPGLSVFLGDAFEKAGRADSANFYWDKGEAGYLRLIESGNNGHLRPLAEFYLARGKNLQKALELAGQDLSIRQDFGAYLTLGRAYLQLGKKKEALAAIVKAGPEAQNDPRFCYWAGEIYLSNGNQEMARKLFARASRLCPKFDLIFGGDLAFRLVSQGKKQAKRN